MMAVMLGRKRRSVRCWRWYFCLVVVMMVMLLLQAVTAAAACSRRRLLASRTQNGGDRRRFITTQLDKRTGSGSGSDSSSSSETLPGTISSEQDGGGDLSKGKPGKRYYGEVKKIGSSPPNCDNKCYGCVPCVAIQVPTVTRHFRLQYANYLPEGWKCKCGPSFYSP